MWTAVILTGGRSTRMGRDKAGTTVGGVTMLDRILAALPPTVPAVVAGPDPGTSCRPVTVRREEPPGGGPVAGIAAALPAVTTDLLAVCAVDMPLAAELLPELVAATATDSDVDATMLADAQGAPQPLCGAYRVAALRAALDRLGDPHGRSVRDLVAPLRVRTRETDVPLRAADADTPQALAVLRAAVGPGGILATSETRRATMQDWVDAVRRELGIETEVDTDLVLDVAKDVAHGVQRPAAPLTTYLVGVAVGQGADPVQAAAAVQRLAGSWTADA